MAIPSFKINCCTMKVLCLYDRPAFLLNPWLKGMPLNSLRVEVVIRRNSDQLQFYKLKITGLLAKAKFQRDQPIDLDKTTPKRCLTD